MLGSVDFCLSLPGLFQLRFLQARFPRGSGHTWMSRGPSADTTDNDEISLAVVFQGLRISVVGPAPQALDFVNKLVPGHNAPAASYPAQGSSPTPSSSVPARDLPAARRCPDSVLALAARLSAASILLPQERIERAWTCGLLARAQLDSGPLPTAQIISIDLPNKWSSGAEGWRSRRSSRAKLPSNGLCKAWNPLKGWDTSFLQRRKQGPISLQQVGDTSQDVRVSRCWRDRSSYGGLGLIASSLGVPRGGFPTLCVGSGNFGTWRRGRHYRSHHCRGRDDAAAGLFGCPARISSFSRSAGARHVGRTRCVGRAFNKSGGASGSNGRRHLAACSSTRCWKAPYSFACGFCQPCILRPQGALLRRSFTDHSLRPARRSPGAMARRCCCACSCMGRRSCGPGGFRTYPILLSRRSPRDTASSCSEKIYQKTHSRWWFRWRRSNCSRSKEETHSGATCREPGSLDSFPSWHHQQTPGALRENQCNGDRAGSHIRRQTISLETASWVVSFNWILAQVQPSAAGQGDASSQKFICSYEGPKSFFCSRRGGGDGFRPPPGLGPPGTGHADAEQGHHRLGYPAGCEQQPFAGLGEHSQLSFQQRCSREGKAADRTCISQRSFLCQRSAKHGERCSQRCQWKQKHQLCETAG